MFRLDKTKSDYQKLANLLKELYHVFSTRSKDIYSQLRINGLVLDIVYILFSSFRWDGILPHLIKTKKRSSRSLEIMGYIERNYRYDISMYTLTRHFELSAEHLSRIFREYYGTTFKKYLTQIRMLHAYKQLINSSNTVTQIALDCGFSDSRAFIASFKKLYGTTPGQYRKIFFENQNMGSNRNK